MCIQGEFTQSRNSEPDSSAKEALQWVHTDLAVPMQIPSMEGYEYIQSFRDNYSCTMLVYYLNCKKDTQVTEKFLADITPYRDILLIKNKTREEISAPYSPHQSGTVERGWWTLYDMSRCLLLESELPDELWNADSCLHEKQVLQWAFKENQSQIVYKIKKKINNCRNWDRCALLTYNTLIN